jgi:hypothetical protein
MREECIVESATGIHPHTNRKKTPTTIDVNMVTVAPILVVLATGILMAVILLVIERCIHGNVLKYLPSGCVREHPKDIY